MSGFVDRAQLHAKGGNGGAGAVSFRREAHVDRGGPDGGDGGPGGDVWLVATDAGSSLIAFRDRPHRRATDGAHGSSKRKRGAAGRDLMVAVPLGTQVLVARSSEVVCDLRGVDDRFLAAGGGRGGRGNASFLSNRRRAPVFAEQGERGEERWFDLELKLVADVAIVGMPNVGKSTLISVISAAKPKIADYPFTTLEPHLGLVRPRGPDELEFVVADVPGLVQGAAQGRGLGHEFLRHVERARVLLILVDLAATGGLAPGDQLGVLLAELEKHERSLLERPRLVVGSKADLVGDRVEDPIAVDVTISAATGEGLPTLVGTLAHMVATARERRTPTPAGVIVHRPQGAELAVQRVQPGCFELVGRAVERAAALSDLQDVQAVEVVLARLKHLGVDGALARAGARDGDEVRVGDLSFSWFKDAGEARLTPDEARRGSSGRSGR
ncbi:MAG: GTPase ObgE [Acidimicrobiales bacterium]